MIATAAQFIERRDAGRSTLRAGGGAIAMSVSSGCTLPLSEPDRRRVADTVADVFRHVTAAEFGPLRADYLGLLRAADVFALPSFEEGLPLAMLEAMAIGLPVISTPVNGIPEAIVSERDGLLVAPGNAEALAAAIARLKASPDLRASLASAGRHRAVTEFDSRTMADVTLGVYAAAFARPC